jgi:alcohol dehydrogenase class IV
LSVPPLSAFGLEQKDLPSIAEKAQKSTSMKGNPVQLTRDELVDILGQAL